MSDLNRFPDSLERILAAAAVRAAQISQHAAMIEEEKLTEQLGQNPTELRALAAELRDDVARWGALLSSARSFAAAVRP